MTDDLKGAEVDAAMDRDDVGSVYAAINQLGAPKQEFQIARVVKKVGRTGNRQPDRGKGALLNFLSPFDDKCKTGDAADADGDPSSHMPTKLISFRD